MSYYSTIILNDGPAGYYRLGDTSGTTAKDQTSNHYDGTINGGVTLNQPGALTNDPGPGMLFDGSTGYIALPSGLQNGAAITLECWIKLTNISYGNYVRVVANDDAFTNNKGVELGLNPSGAGGFFNLGFSSSHVSVGFSTQLSASSWYHLAATYNGTTALLYLNGLQVGSQVVGSTLVAGSSTYNIARNGLIASTYTPATMDEVAIYNIALTATQILNHYNAGLRPGTTFGGIVTNAGVNLYRDGSSGANNPLIKYVALGTSNTAPTVNDTQLGNEVFRKAVTSYTNGSNPGEVIIAMYMAPGDGTGTNIQEVGFFGGSSATALSNTGVLLARGLYSHPSKLGTESITFQLDFTA